MDTLEEKEMKKIRPIKNTWYEWLVNYIPESITKSADGFKDQVVSLLRQNHLKKTVYGGGKKLNKSKTQK